MQSRGGNNIGKKTRGKRRAKSSKSSGKPQKWIGKLKKGALSRQLGIPEKKNIPINLLKKIKSAKVGEKIKNPSKTGKSSYNVTALMKKRASTAITLKSLKK